MRRRLHSKRLSPTVRTNTYNSASPAQLLYSVFADSLLVFQEPTDRFVTSFQWSTARYRSDRPLGEIIDILQKELQNTDNDVKAKFAQYNAVKTNLAALQRRQTYDARRPRPP